MTWFGTLRAKLWNSDVRPEFPLTHFSCFQRDFSQQKLGEKIQHQMFPVCQWNCRMWWSFIQVGVGWLRRGNKHFSEHFSWAKFFVSDERNAWMEIQLLGWSFDLIMTADKCRQKRTYFQNLIILCYHWRKSYQWSEAPWIRDSQSPKAVLVSEDNFRNSCEIWCHFVRN